MKQQPAGYFVKVIRSFGYAGKGIFLFFRSPSNAWLHVAALILVTSTGFFLHISGNEWISIAIACSSVIACEMLNTSIELLTDMVMPGYNKKAGKVKDIAAGAVLVTALGALVVGLVIFLPKIF